MRVFSAALIGFLLLAMPCANAEQVAEGVLVAVQGVLQVGEFFGPPNYGENPGADRIEKSYFLQLPASLETELHAAHSDGFSSEVKLTYFVQLVVFDKEQVSAKRLVGKKVKVSGTLLEAQTGHHRTPILLQVKSIAEIKQWG